MSPDAVVILHQGRFLSIDKAMVLCYSTIKRMVLYDNTIEYVRKEDVDGRAKTGIAIFGFET